MNNVTLIGRLGKDVESKTTPNGTQIYKVSLATKDGTSQAPKTNWHNLVLFGQPGNYLASYAGKGDIVAVQGQVSYREWDDKDGKKCYMTEIVCSRSEILKSSKERSPAENAARILSEPIGPSPLIDPSLDEIPF